MTGPAEVIGRGRLEALSDGVFAIVLTLLVLELHPPHLATPDSVREAALALTALAPKFTSWVISFVTVCVIWLNHHRLMTITERIDNGLFWWNAHLLLWTSLIPFPTGLMGDFPTNPLVVSLYGIVMGLMAVSFVLIRLHLQRHPNLRRAHVDAAALRRGTVLSVLVGPLAYAACAAAAWLDVRVAFMGYAAIALYFVFPHGTHTSSANEN